MTDSIPELKPETLPPADSSIPLPQFTKEDMEFLKAVSDKFYELATTFASGRWYFAAEKASQSARAFLQVKTIFEREKALQDYFGPDQSLPVQQKQKP